MARKPKRISAFFYQTVAGAEPVRDWLKTLDEEDRKIIRDDIATVELGLTSRNAGLQGAGQRPLVGKKLAGEQT
jgi:hypothetical protein